MNDVTQNAGELTLAAARATLAKAKGRRPWRSLEELASSSGFPGMLAREMPQQAAGITSWDPIDRRDFLRLMGASLALGGLTACTKQPPEKIVPYVVPPEELIPGKPLFYATAFTQGGYAQGVLAESHMGRPTKVEGNPGHPASLGATDIFAQASVLQLYDPDRAQAHRRAGRLSSWDAFAKELEEALVPLQLARGGGLRILTGAVTSPTLAAQLAKVLEQYPEARWHQYDPLHDDHAHEGAVLAFGEPVSVRYRLDQAKVIVSLDADFLARGPGHLAYARAFAKGRGAADGAAEMNRLYVVESAPTLAGANADHKIAVRPTAVEHIARALARGLNVDVPAGEDTGHGAWIAALVQDLKLHRGEAVVLAGAHQPPAVHAIAHAINDQLGAFGRTMELTEPVEARPENHLASIRELASAMKAGQVQVLLVLGGNPAYDAPADLAFGEALKNVKLAVHHGLYEDETSRLCRWHLAAAHYLETWGDARAFDGTVSIQQPLIEPLYNGKAETEVVSALLGRAGRKALEIVQEQWKAGQSDGFERAWRRWLHDGVVPDSAAAPKSLVAKAVTDPAKPIVALTPLDLELVFQPDPCVGDGSWANNAWLQELPRPLTKIVWDNVVLLAPQTAAYRRLENGFLVELKVDGRTVDAPVFIVPGHPEDVATVYLGGGRTAAGRTGNGVGFNAHAIRTSASPWIVLGTARDTGRTQDVVSTQGHDHLEGRHHYRTADLATYKHEPEFVKKFDEFGAQPVTLMPGFGEVYSQGNQWGMVINLNACIGCNACMIACQAENNISVVGKEQAKNGREMHWIRVDRYYEGDPAHPATYIQPVTCMQCENAPCEAVCPVAATVHSNDGINQMVYNRCVGTRYCSNNCPYKVRRFNFLKFADHTTPSLKLQRNPDVTVRARGVMEKCTFCTQRISEARIEAKKQNRLVREGEVLTACQQVCPTNAIVFGDINDPESAVSRLRKSPLHYGMLVELNTRPRTTYLARVTNPNPALQPAETPAEAGHHA